MYGCNLQISYIFINFETKYHILITIIKTLILELFSYINVSAKYITSDMCDKTNSFAGFVLELCN